MKWVKFFSRICIIRSRSLNKPFGLHSPEAPPFIYLQSVILISYYLLKMILIWLMNLRFCSSEWFRSLMSFLLELSIISSLLFFLCLAECGNSRGPSTLYKPLLKMHQMQLSILRFVELQFCIFTLFLSLSSSNSSGDHSVLVSISNDSSVDSLF